MPKPDVDVLDAIDELVKIEAEIERRKVENKCKYFVPTGKQEEFIRLVAEGNKFINIFSGGNGSGKTAIMVNVIINIALTYRNKWFKYDYFKQRFQGRKILVASTPTGITDVIIPAFKEWLPKNSYYMQKRGKSFESFINIMGTHIYLMTYEQDVMEYEGKTINLCWFDEPPPEKIFNAVIARFRFGGKILVSMTPLQHAAYLYDLIGKSDDIGIVYSDIEDACKQHGVRGFLEHEDIQRMIAQYPEEERMARKEGKFMHLRGLVFKEFNDNVHVVKEFPIPHHWRRFMAVDPHDRQPNFVLWLAVDPTGDCYIYDEDFETDLISDLVSHIRQHEGMYGRADVRVIDPNFGPKRYGNTGRTVMEEIEIESRRAGYPMRFALGNDDIVLGHKKIHEYLRYDPNKPLGLRNHPKLYVFSRCRHFIYMIKHYMYKDWKEGVSSEKPPNPKPDERFKHAIDCLRYILMHKPEQLNLKARSGRGGY